MSKPPAILNVNAGEPAPIERRLARLTLLANVVPTLMLLIALWHLQVSRYLLGIVTVLLGFLTFYSVFSVWRQTQYQFRSLHNLLDAIVDGDYSIRAAHVAEGAFGSLVVSINSLAETLQKQRLLSEESKLLVEKIVEAMDVAIIAWDQHDRVRMFNPAAQRLVGPVEVAQALPLTLAFTSEMEVGETSVRELVFGEQRGRYRVHLQRFIAEGNTHWLLFITNLSSILRLEERRAWRNLVRVLSHEINNSLAPLKSFSNTLVRQIEKRESDEHLKTELVAGLEVIGKRAESVADFVQRYRAIAGLPEPKKEAVDLAVLVQNLVRLFPAAEWRVEGHSLMIDVDAAQLEQALINLMKNAIEASEVSPIVSIDWGAKEDMVLVRMTDNGTGIQNRENLFTPYYTTKSGGSGIGLVFCQQVIEAHGGFLSIGNRTDARGCEVIIGLPRGG